MNKETENPGIKMAEHGAAEANEWLKSIGYQQMPLGSDSQNVLWAHPHGFPFPALRLDKPVPVTELVRILCETVDLHARSSEATCRAIQLQRLIRDDPLT